MTSLSQLQKEARKALDSQAWESGTIDKPAEDMYPFLDSIVEKSWVAGKQSAVEYIKRHSKERGYESDRLTTYAVDVDILSQAALKADQSVSGLSAQAKADIEKFKQSLPKADQSI